MLLEKVSIICTTYMQEKYIGRAINSFKEQDYKNVEFIILDDCSTDSTSKVLDELIGNDKRFVVIKNELNLGAHKNVRKGLSIATGQYIGFCEGDDYLIGSDRITQQVNSLSLDPTISMVFTKANIVSESDCFLNVHSYGSNIRYFNVNESMRIGGNLCVTASTLYRRIVIDSLPEQFFNYPVGDYPLQVIAASIGRVCYLPFIGAAYRKSALMSWTLSMSDEAKFITNHYKTLSMLDELYCYCSGLKYSSVLYAKSKYWYFFSLNKRIKIFKRLDSIFKQKNPIYYFFIFVVFLQPLLSPVNNFRRLLVNRMNK